MTDQIDPEVDDGPTVEEAKAEAAKLAFTPDPDAADLPTDVPVGDPSADD